MCVTIIKSSKQVSYNENLPLEDQIDDGNQIIINYDPCDKSIDKFLKEMQRFVKNGISAKLDIKFFHNNQLIGFKTGKKIKKANNDIYINEIIKAIVLYQSEIDKKLENIVNFCNKTVCNER